MTSHLRNLTSKVLTDRLLNREHKMAAGASVVRDSDISVLPAIDSVT